VEAGGWLAFCVHADGRSGGSISWHFQSCDPDRDL